jgi:protein-S-isoprenylcysteine O-methyltransferase Ste14/rhodanese-related sulfurtransferase
VFTIAAYLAAALVVVVALWVPEVSESEADAIRSVITFLVAVPAALLLVFSLGGLLSYFLFLPSLSRDSHLFARIHATHLLHPLTTSIVLGLLAVSIDAGNIVVWLSWAVLFVIYLTQTALMVCRLRSEELLNGLGGGGGRISFLLGHVMLGGDLITLAGGAKPLLPWRLKTLPEETWIVDVRTKAEYHWNRLQGAENYPWGKGLAEAAQHHPKDRPVLVTCFSGHRSPAIAVMLRRMGFRTVYNLSWGILYLLLLERGRKQEGPFALTRAHRDPSRRGEDLRTITHGYITLIFVTLIGAPLEWFFFDRSASAVQLAIGAVLGLTGLFLGILSFLALGRNFRVYAAPRRSGALIQTGVYKYVRHPMYSGVVLGLAGYVLCFGSYFFILTWAAVAVLYVLKGVKEEAILLEKFPEYDEYRKRTWRFIPCLH